MSAQSSGKPRVIVIGGGVIGSAVAWRLSRRECEVLLLERGALTDGDATTGRASTAAAGMLTPLKEAEEIGPFLELGLRSMDRYPTFVEELEATTERDVGFMRGGRLDVAFDTQAADVLRRHHELQADAGYESQLLDPSDVRRIEPHIGPELILGLATDYDFQLDPGSLTRVLWDAAGRTGADTRASTVVEAVRTDGDRTLGVTLDTGEELDADVVVVAAGAWVGRIELPLPVPVRPVRGQVVRLETAAPVLSRTVWMGHTYLVPRPDGQLLVGSTMEEVGFDVRTTASAVSRLLSTSIRVVPALDEARVDGFQVGLRPAAEDDLPIIGPDPTVGGLFYATGHFRNGILLAPETAAQITAMILDGGVPEPPFDPARFAP